MLNGEMPETIMSGETQDISQFCEFEFYERIMFRNKPISYTYDNPVMGIYLGPIIDVCTDITAKILKQNYEAVNRSTYWAITTDTIQGEEHTYVNDIQWYYMKYNPYTTGYK